MSKDFRNKSVDISHFSMVPRSDIPRSSFDRQWMHKTTFDAGYLVPVLVDEVVPGDVFKLNMTAFCRMATPIYPVMDNLHLDSFFFFVPVRLVWDNFVKFMGEQKNPADSISYTVPQMVSKASGYDIGGLHDYMGLPTLGQVTAAATVSHNALPLRCYNLIWNEWFRDENLQNSAVVDVDDGPDLYTDYVMRRRGKRHDYFAAALPWPQKGSTPVSIPIGTSAPVMTQAANVVTGVREGLRMLQADGGAPTVNKALAFAAAGDFVTNSASSDQAPGERVYPSNLYADLSTATAATINQLRQAFAIQRMLERDARGGTRYTEIVRSQFGVLSPDARLQRPEYLGGGSMMININSVAQTSGTSASGTTTPLGNLAGVGTGVASGHGFTQSFTEHGYVVGLVSVRADLTYQQGIRRMWNRSTRYDFYSPVFAHLGEQTVLNKEIYCKGDSDANDALVFGYQERWAEMRYFPSQITGLFRSTAAGTLDGWHLAQKFTALPVLNDSFIQDTPPLSRVLAVGAAANGAQFIFDSMFNCRTVRPMPMYSVPGLIDHF